MANQLIGIGAAANDGNGDPIRTAFDKCNQNFSELYGDDGGIVNYDNVVSAILRPGSDGTWSILDNASHTPINADSVSVTGGVLRLVYGKTFSKIRSFIAVGDESLGRDFSFGASVGTTQADITLSTMGGIGGYISYNGSSWNTVAAYGINGTPTFSNGILTVPVLRHAGGFEAQVNCREGDYVAAIGANSSGQIDIHIRDHNGNYVTTPDTNMRFRLSCGNVPVLDPSLVRSDQFPTANIWVFGLFDK